MGARRRWHQGAGVVAVVVGSMLALAGWGQPPGAARPQGSRPLVGSQAAAVSARVVSSGTVAVPVAQVRARTVAAPARQVGSRVAAAPARQPRTRPAAAPDRAGPRTSATPAAPQTVSADVRVVPTGEQSIDGFGVSGGWWPTALGQFPAAAQRQLGELLFSPTGLAVSQYRYNIGGGGVGVTDPYKAPPAFLGPAGTYDWSADPNGLAFLQMAAAYGVPQLIGFVNSAPAQFTSNGKSCGGTLRPDRINAFAAYLGQVVDHLYTADHIRLSYVSPMNEPDASQWKCRQEGMAVPVKDRAAVVRAVAQAVGTGPAHAAVIADETSLVKQLLVEAPRWLPAAGKDVAVLAHHTYDYPDAAVLARVAQLPVTHWATEICCYNGSGFGWQYDPTMTSALWMAHTIFGDLGTARDSAFDWWVAASPNIGCSPARQPGCQDHVNPTGRNDGLVYFDPNWQTDGNDTLYLTKRYWALASFSRYVQPGAVLHQVSGLPADTEALAFQSSHGWVVVAANYSGSRRVDAAVHLPAGLIPTGTSAYTTDDRLSLAAVPAPVSAGAVKVELAPHSITSVIVPVRAAVR